MIKVMPGELDVVMEAEKYEEKNSFLSQLL